MADAAEHCWTLALEAAKEHHLRRLIKKGADVTALEKWGSTREVKQFAESTQSERYACYDKGGHMLSKLSDLIRAVHRYAPAFDVFVAQQPFIASVAWGTIRFLVQVAVSGIELSERIAGALIETLPNLGRYEREANLFPNHPGVLGAVQTLFTNIIVLVVQAREHFGRSKIIQWWRAAFSSRFEDMLKPIQDCTTLLDQELRTAALQVQKEEFAKQDLYRGEASQRLQRIENDTQSLLAVTKRNPLCNGASKMLLGEAPICIHRLTGKTSPQRFVEWLSNGAVEADYVGDPEPTTCQRIYQHQEWQGWELAGYPRTLLLSGKQGIGKSVYAKSIGARANENGKRVVLTHFFRYSAGDESSDAKSFAISVLWQLCQDNNVIQCDGFTSVLHNVTPLLNAFKSVRECHIKRLLRLLDEVLRITQPFTLVVDALDECTKDSDDLRQFLIGLGQQPHAQVIATSRSILTSQRDRGKVTHICLDQELVKPDIAYFVEQEILRNKKFQKLQEDISQTVIQHSQGIFLHAKLLINDLKTAKSANQQRKKMKAFSLKFPDEYKRLYKENCAKLNTTERGRRDDILRLLIAAKRRFKAQDVTQLLALSDITNTIDTGDIEFDPDQEIIRLCQPFVDISSQHFVCFIHGSAKVFLLECHLSESESNLFLARKCLSVLSQSTYRDCQKAAALLRKHLLAGTAYALDSEGQLENSAIYEYATLHFQEHVVAVSNPPDDLVAKLARFLQGTEFVTWSENLFDLKKQSGLGGQVAVFNRLSAWTKFLPDPIRAEIPIRSFFEMPHAHLSLILKEESKDKLLQYLPQVRVGQYFNAGGQCTEDWQKAYENKESVVAGITKLLGSDNPVTLRFRASLLQEYFWQKRFDEVLEELLIVSKLQRKVVGEKEPDLYTTLWLLGAAYHCLTRFDEALSTFDEAASGLERLSGKSSRAALVVTLYKGHTLEQLFQFEAATTLYEDISKSIGSTVGPINSFTLMSQTAVGAIQRKEGKYEKAEKNLFEGWAGRKQLLPIHVNVCLDAAVQLALLYRDKGQGKLCLDVLDAVSDSTVYQHDFERYCQTEHIRALVAFDQGEYIEPKLTLLKLLDKVSGSNRMKNNRELLWVRITLADVMRQHGEANEALMVFSELVEPTDQDSASLSDEPEPPTQLQLAEDALRLVRKARAADATKLLQKNGLKWVRENDFWILGEGGPVTDTACIAPIHNQ